MRLPAGLHFFTPHAIFRSDDHQEDTLHFRIVTLVYKNDSDISDLGDDGIQMLKRQLIELEKGHSMETIRENIKNRKLFGNQFVSYDPYKEQNTAILKKLIT